ncbi:hypothetical protein Mal64_28200 [Pseudobythopirellula maris]|uniref:Rhamnogalacturonan lyase domain-containing protein n=1 Tax=Pseudobythopirellula maris TaxID=2527991 RepID=A0A5C5ZIR1_9BACT|nr:hypothetical protein [Pseudobythopirellula maris]TWT87282.1 hypothetical protein Mal64_28200 [Pseudobythopirellula maris]
MRFYPAVTAALLVLAAAAHAQETAGWGALSGRIVVVGEAPAPVAITPKNDRCCIDAKPVDERVLVGSEGGLLNALVYLRPVRGAEPPVHPDLAALPAAPVEVDNAGCSFRPRVSLVRAGQSLLLKNTDPTTHNVNAPFRRNGAFNLVVAAGATRTLQLDEGEGTPTPLACNIHPFMRGYVLVRDDPYMTLTAEDGAFRIDHLPAGEWRFQFWHETGYLAGATFTEGPTTDRLGRATIRITAGGETRLGELRVDGASLE